MTRNWKAGVSAAVLSLSILGVGAAGASAQTTPTTPVQNNANWMRGENRSNTNIRRDRMRLERIIDMLQHDRRDYGGQREQALDLLQQARQHLLMAEQYEQTHPGQ